MRKPVHGMPGYASSGRGVVHGFSLAGRQKHALQIVATQLGMIMVVVLVFALIACTAGPTPTPAPTATPAPPRTQPAVEKATAAPPSPAPATRATVKPDKPLTAVEIAALPLGPERQRILEEGARRERELMLYTTSTGLEPVAVKFMEKYPFIKMEVFASRDEPLTQRTLAEAKAGRINGDIVETGIFVQDNLKELLVKFNSPQAKFNTLPYAADFTLTGIVFAYSAQRVAAADVPRKVEDLLLPRWKQNIGLFGVPNSYPGRWVGALVQNLGEQPARDFLRKLADQKPYFYAQPEVGRNGLLAGEWDINMQGITSTVVSVRRGAPIGWTALDPTTMSMDTIALFKLAPHPYAAMLFLDWVLTPEGRNLVSEVNGSATLEELEKREKEGVKLPARIAIQSLSDVDKLPGWMKLFEELVQKK